MSKQKRSRPVGHGEIDQPMMTEDLKHTNVLLWEPLTSALVDLAYERGHSMDTVARHAVIDFARDARVDLDGGYRVMIPRRPKSRVEGATSRRLWVRYPMSWVPLLDDVARRVGVARISDVWRLALIRICKLHISGFPPSTPIPETCTSATT